MHFGQILDEMSDNKSEEDGYTIFYGYNSDNDYYGELILSKRGRLTSFYYRFWKKDSFRIIAS